jgi:Ca-activated chloride channel family protein
MKFLHPLFLSLLALAPAYVFWLWRKRKGKEAIRVSVLEDLAAARRFSVFDYIPYVQDFLAVCIIILFVLTLARPQTLHEKTESSQEGIDIIIALDVSGSMLAEDLAPNRIEAAKVEIKKFIEKLSTDRLGIVVFAGQAFTQSPLSFDYEILIHYLDDISTDSINQEVRGLNGTAVGDAILAAINRFKKSEDRSKVLILLTDGDANTGIEPSVAAKMAKKENIRIHTIGIGDKDGAPLPVTNAFGQKDYARNRDGSLVKATFNEEKLKEIANIGEGTYARADEPEALQKIFDNINQLEKRPIKTSQLTDARENFWPFLLALSLLFLFYLALGGLRAIRK